MTTRPGLTAGVLGARPRLRALLISAACLPLGALCFIAGFGAILETSGDAGIEALTAFLLLDLAVGVVACALAGPARRSTIGNALLIAVGIVSTFALPACAVAIIRFGERRSLATDAVIVVSVSAGAAAMSIWHDRVLGEDPVNPLIVAALAAAATFALLLWGRVRATRSALLAASRDRAESAEFARAALARSREAELARARAEERAALARDLHDGISHRLSIVAMHAGALASRDDLSSEQVRGATRTIRDAAAEAGDLLREALTALRDGGEARELRTTTAQAVGSTLARAADRGTSAGLRWRGIEPEELDSASPRAVLLLRFLEEVLMNATTHAPGEPVEIEVARDETTVGMRARNRIVEREGVDEGAAALGTGHGLVGLRERAVLLGGDASYGATADGAFETEVRIPWE